MKKTSRILISVIVFVILLSTASLSATALNWNGTAVQSVGASNAQSTAGYTIRLVGNDGCFGYRFSVVDANGKTRSKSGYPTAIDVYRAISLDSTLNKVYNSYYSASTKYNKKQLITNRSSVSLSMTRINGQSNSYMASSMGFSTALPAPSGMETWQTVASNLNKVLAKLGMGSVNNFVYGDRLLVEPLFVMQMKGGNYNAMTATEIALYGAAFYGNSNSTGGASSNAGTWGFIASYTNMYYPRALYTANNTMLTNLWGTASNLTSQTSFENIITKGYGVGIAYSNYNKYKVTLVQGTGISSVSGAGTYAAGASVTINASLKTGYKWDKWTGTKGTGTQKYTFSMPSGNVTNTAHAVLASYTIKHNPNGGSWNGSSDTDSRTYTISSGIHILVAPTRTGYSFGGWKVTSAEGNWTLNTVYNVSTTALYLTNMYGNVTLTAQWIPNILTVCYDCYGSNVTIADTSKGFTLANYNRICSTTQQNKTIADTPNVYYQSFPYNSAIGGSGLHDFSTFGLKAPTGYEFSHWANGTKKFSQSVTTYKPTDFTSDIANGSTYIWMTAKFSPINYTIKYNANGGTGTTASSSHTYNVSKVLSANNFIRIGYTFKNWNTKADGTGTAYTNQQAVKNLTSANGATINLYAQWTPITYKINFNGNGNTGGATSSMSMTYDVSKNLTKNGFSKTGYTFKNWNTKADGTGTAYTNQQAVKNLTSTNGATINLYAQWTPVTYTIVFNGNGNTAGTTASLAMTYDVSKNLTKNGYSKAGCSFIQWNTKADGTGNKYIDGQSVKNLTSVNGDIITLFAQWKDDRQLELEAVTPNAPYREGTDVITSFNILNKGSADCLPEDNVNVVFKVYNGGNVIKTVTKTQVVVPGNDKNLLYFKWTVPVNINGSVVISGEITEKGRSYSLIKKEYATSKYTISETPDTRYAVSAPGGFAVPSVPAVYDNTASWSEWSYSNGALKKTLYGIGISSAKPSITPDTSANADLKNGVWTIKSGYGFSISVSDGVKSLNRYTMPSSDSYTTPQYVTVQFPEFSYLTNTSCYRTLQLISGKWIFRDNLDYGKIHFIPLWYPDGNYTVSVLQSDMWTPGGMLSRRVNSNTFIISGSAYDDWYIN